MSRVRVGVTVDSMLAPTIWVEIDGKSIVDWCDHTSVSRLIDERQFLFIDSTFIN